uniref:Short neuropeptide F n=1 Tax=Glossina pallidipes TaxID=7398 RepID=A0A1A9ZP04_GLOPL
MHFRSRLFCQLTGVIFIMLIGLIGAELLPDDSALNTFYENLLQREYAGPVILPNHQLERKAQRSPSLRLRFGRRNDPELIRQLPIKRWFGDVNQKPIRSPSLRLRFGRRSDPSMPLRSPLDMLVNARFSQNLANDNDYNDLFGGYYHRVVRKPQRLRFGRSLPMNIKPENFNNDILSDDEEKLNTDADEVLESNKENDFLNTLVQSSRLRNLLEALREYEHFHEDIDDEANEKEFQGEENMDEFERAIRKPARLRFGRSTNNNNVNTQSKTAQKEENSDKKTDNGRKSSLNQRKD